MASFADFENLNNLIIETEKAIEERDRILNIKASVDKQLAHSRQLAEFQQTTRDKEEADVIELERPSFRTFLYKLRGIHHERLAQEIEEWLAAKILATETLIHVQSLKDRLAELEEQLVALADCDTSYNQLLLQREKLVTHIDKLSGGNLHLATKALASLNRHQHELLAAFDAGSLAINAVNDIVDALEELNEPMRSLANKHSLALTPTNTHLQNAIKLAEKGAVLAEKFQIKLYDLPDRYRSIMRVLPPRRVVQAASKRIKLHFGPVISTTWGGVELIPLSTKHPNELPRPIKEWQSHLQDVLRLMTENVERLKSESDSYEERIRLTEIEIDLLYRTLWSAQSFLQE